MAGTERFDRVHTGDGNGLSLLSSERRMLLHITSLYEFPLAIQYAARKGSLYSSRKRKVEISALQFNSEVTCYRGSLHRNAVSERSL